MISVRSVRLVRPRIGVVNLGVADVSRSRAFYEGLGFVARPESSDRAVFFALEWTWLALFERELLASLAETASAGSGYPGFCLSHYVTTPEEVDAVVESVVACGGSVVLEPKDSPGARIAYIADPDGFQWEIAWAPYWHELTD
jgi:predicted lactoylglutathione lyase